MSTAIVRATDETKKRNTVAEQTLAMVRTLSVTTTDEAETAEAWRRDISEAMKDLDAIRRTITDPLHQAKTACDALFKPVTQVLEQARDVVDGLIAEYVQAAKERQRKAFAEAAEQHAAGNHEAAREIVGVSNANAERVAPAGVNVKEVWTPEIIYPKTVPRDWCIPDVDRLKALGKATSPELDPPQIMGVAWRLVAAVRGTSKGPRTSKVSQLKAEDGGDE